MLEEVKRNNDEASSVEVASGASGVHPAARSSAALPSLLCRVLPTRLPEHRPERPFCVASHQRACLGRWRRTLRWATLKQFRRVHLHRDRA